jgi:hypothetical protein
MPGEEDTLVQVFDRQSIFPEGGALAYVERVFEAFAAAGFNNKGECFYREITHPRCIIGYYMRPGQPVIVLEFWNKEGADNRNALSGHYSALNPGKGLIPVSPGPVYPHKSEHSVTRRIYQYMINAMEGHPAHSRLFESQPDIVLPESDRIMFFDPSLGLK